MAASQSRRPARRLFAAELEEATHEFRESDDDRAPKYHLLPSGERANRVCIVGTVTETEDVGNDDEYWRARIVDPSGAAFAYAGTYQPDCMETIRNLRTPAYVAVVGKVDSYDASDEGEEPDINVNISPETITVVDEDTRDRWVMETAEQTLTRLERDEHTHPDSDKDYVEMAEKVLGDRDRIREVVVEALEEHLENSGG